jgi:hypothetical protein
MLGDGTLQGGHCADAVDAVGSLIENYKVNDAFACRPEAALLLFPF